MTVTSRRQVWFLVGIGAVIHFAMILYDISNSYEPFLWGDRSPDRWAVMLQALSPPRSLFDFIVHAKVAPGEYIFQLPFYMAAGKAGVVAFQTVLNLVAVACLYYAANVLFCSPSASLIIAFVYLCLPQNLVYPHEFVTEAVATPLTTVFVFLIVLSTSRSRVLYALLGAVIYGVAIFVRPSLVFALPCLWLLNLFTTRPTITGVSRASFLCGIALLPIVLWATLFSLDTGKLGYTNGVANLSWNLRSKVYLIFSRNGIEQPPELDTFASYEDLYDDYNGISVKRYLQLVAPHPRSIIIDSIISTAIAFGRGNVTKILVDYLGVSQGKSIKHLPRSFQEGHFISSLRGSADVIITLTLEAIASVATSVVVVTASGFAACSLCIRRVRLGLQQPALQAVIVSASLLFAVLLSSNLVDEAQGRLRNPAEGGILLLFGLAFAHRRTSSSEDRGA